MYNFFPLGDDLPPHLIHLKKSLREAAWVALGVTIGALVVWMF